MRDGGGLGAARTGEMTQKGLQERARISGILGRRLNSGRDRTRQSTTSLDLSLGEGVIRDWQSRLGLANTNTNKLQGHMTAHVMACLSRHSAEPETDFTSQPQMTPITRQFPQPWPPTTPR